MKNKLSNIIIIIFTIFVFYLIIINKYLVKESIITSLNIWINNLLPTLFPFFIITDILINYNITAYIPNFLKKICQRLFNISDNMLTILILSIISGFPSNAKNTRLMYDQKKISLEEANHILIFSHFANPIFILSTISIFFLNNKKIGPLLLISHYLSNFLLGILIRPFLKKKSIQNNKIYNNNQEFGNILITSINKSIDTILTICGIITIFFLLSSLLIKTFNLNNYTTTIIKGIFEITIGIESLSKLPIPSIYKTIITSAILSFGGLSVHLQVKSQLTNTKISYHYFFLGRLLQTIISIIITYLLSLIVGI